MNGSGCSAACVQRCLGYAHLQWCRVCDLCNQPLVPTHNCLVHLAAAHKQPTVCMQQQWSQNHNCIKLKACPQSSTVTRKYGI
jgi:hypothetical protein